MQTVNNIVSAFENFRMPQTANDLFQQTGKDVLRNRIAPFVARNEPVKFVMLGFPMKSPNDRDKVLGSLPDMGEEIAIHNFGRFNEAVRQHYAPGVDVSVVSDGYVFNDLLNVSDATVQRYEEQCLEMAKGLPITWHDLKDFYDRNATLATMREKVTAQFGITDGELERRILLDPDVNELYRGMIKFLTLDIATREFSSNSQLQKEAKRLARQMMFRNETYSALIRKEFSTHIRLSMHPSVNNGTKYSFQLIPSPKARQSPWHSSLLVDNDGQYATILKRDGIKEGFELVYKDGQPYYFINNKK